MVLIQCKIKKQVCIYILSQIIECQVNVKVRIFNDFQEPLEFVQRVEECGV